MSRAAKVLADYVLHKGVINKDEYDMYEYGFQIALETGFSLIISGLIASMLHMIPEGILFFIVFIPLRSYAGGLHLNQYLHCLILSCLTFSVVLLIVKYVRLPMFILFIAFLVMEIAIYYMYPVENINREVDEDENRFFRRRLIKFLIFDMGIFVFCMFFKKDSYMMDMAVTFFMVTITMLWGKHKNGAETQKTISK